MKTKLTLSLAFIICIFFVSNGIAATSYTATSCSKLHVKTAMNSCFADQDCTTVYIPAGDCTWELISGNTTNGCDNSYSGCITVVPPHKSISIIGSGSSSTILRMVLGTTGKGFFKFDCDDESGTNIRISGIQFIAPKSGASHFAIDADDPDWLQVDNCIFAASWWNSVIGGKRIDGGLIFSNKFTWERTDGSATDYGISPGMNQGWLLSSCATGSAYTIDGTNKCDTWGTTQCMTWWKKYWNKAGCQGGIPYKENWDPSNLTQTLFVEGNTFNWHGSAIELNWGSSRAVVWRYNTMTNADGNNGGWKPGAWYVLFYHNTVENIEGGVGSSAVYGRDDALVYHNTFKKYGYMGEITAWTVAEGYLYTLDPRVRTNEYYAWDNTCENCTCGTVDSGCWLEPGSMGENILTENVEYFFRAPTGAERLAGFSWPTCPHPSSGLTGGCSATLNGINGYNVGGGDPPPAAPNPKIINP